MNQMGTQGRLAAIFVVALAMLSACAQDTQHPVASAVSTPPTAPAPASSPDALPVALAQLHAAALHGDARAQYRLGLAYAEGRGIKPDTTKALQWWRASARTCKPRSLCRVRAPVDCSCRDGAKFTIVFTQSKDQAFLAIEKHPVMERLENARLGTGIAYRGKTHVFEQHREMVSMTTLDGTREHHTTCRVRDQQVERPRHDARHGG